MISFNYPSGNIGESFSIQLNDIQAIKKKTRVYYDEGKMRSINWLIESDSRIFDVSDFSIFKLDDIFEEIKKRKHNIHYVEETIRDDF